MSYTTSITCDCGCEATVQVPAPGHMPIGWVVVSYPTRTVLTSGNAGGPIGPQHQPGVEQRTLVFAGWRCVNKHVKSMLRGEEPVSE